MAQMQDYTQENFPITPSPTPPILKSTYQHGNEHRN